jgi:hypothetical protein
MDPHHLGKLDPDPLKVESWIGIMIHIKVKSRIRKSEKVDALEGHFGA